MCGPKHNFKTHYQSYMGNKTHHEIGPAIGHDNIIIIRMYLRKLNNVSNIEAKLAIEEILFLQKQHMYSIYRKHDDVITHCGNQVVI